MGTGLRESATCLLGKVFVLQLHEAYVLVCLHPVCPQCASAHQQRSDGCLSLTLSMRICAHASAFDPHTTGNMARAVCVVMRMGCHSFVDTRKDPSHDSVCEVTCSSMHMCAL
jgi:hypothetical protein